MNFICIYKHSISYLDDIFNRFGSCIILVKGIPMLHDEPKDKGHGLKCPREERVIKTNAACLGREGY